MTRRDFLSSTACAGLIAALSSFVPGFLQHGSAQVVSNDDLMADQGLPEKSVGAADAPITLIEYASLTCSHCADFHNKTYPVLKERYIDTGKVRMIFREFPLDRLAAAGFMLARCTDDQYFPIVETLFKQQKQWLVQKPLEPLKTLVKPFGIADEKFEQCLANQEVLDGLETVRKNADKLGVTSTPTFFVNGRIARGALSIEELEKLFQPHLKS